MHPLNLFMRQNLLQTQSILPSFPHLHAPQPRAIWPNAPSTCTSMSGTTRSLHNSLPLFVFRWRAFSSPKTRATSPMFRVLRHAYPLVPEASPHRRYVHAHYFLIYPMHNNSIAGMRNSRIRWPHFGIKYTTSIGQFHRKDQPNMPDIR